MTNKTAHIKPLTFIIALFCAVNLGYGQSIFTNSITGTAIDPEVSNPYITGQIVDQNITVSGIGKSGVTGITTDNRYNASNWGADITADNTKYFEFTLTPNAGYEIDFVSFTFQGQRNSFNYNYWLDCINKRNSFTSISKIYNWI